MKRQRDKKTGEGERKVCYVVRVRSWIPTGANHAKYVMHPKYWKAHWIKAATK